jgi:methyl-accepting chemotaxis protein
MQTMRDGLTRIVGQVYSSDTIASAAGQIANGNLDLSSRTEQQASTLEETASSMEELTSTVRLNTDRARKPTVWP